MERRSVETVIAALEAAQDRHRAVEGVAVVAHGHMRFTADLDLVFDPDEAALRRAISALSALGYRPRAPVAFDAFAGAERRRLARLSITEKLDWLEAAHRLVLELQAKLARDAERRPRED